MTTIPIIVLAALAGVGEGQQIRTEERRLRTIGSSDVKTGEYGNDACPVGSAVVMDLAECKKIATLDAKFGGTLEMRQRNWVNRSEGCLQNGRGGRIYFNSWGSKNGNKHIYIPKTYRRICLVIASTTTTTTTTTSTTTTAFIVNSKKGDSCPSGYRSISKDLCKIAGDKLGSSYNKRSLNSKYYPPGCITDPRFNELIFNEYPNAKARDYSPYRVVCLSEDAPASSYAPSPSKPTGESAICGEAPTDVYWWCKNSKTRLEKCPVTCADEIAAVERRKTAACYSFQESGCPTTRCAYINYKCRETDYVLPNTRENCGRSGEKCKDGPCHRGRFNRIWSETDYSCDKPRRRSASFFR